MRIEAKRVIIGLLQEYARKTEELSAKDKEEIKKQQKEALAFWKTEIESYPNKYLNLTGFGIFENDETKKLRKKLEERFPEAGVGYGSSRKYATVQFLALDIRLQVQGDKKIKKFQALSKQIDNAFLEGDAVNLVDLIKKSLS